MTTLVSPASGQPINSTWTDGVSTELNARRVIKRAVRTTSSTGTTTEIGVLRIDNIPTTLLRFYQIYTSPLSLQSTVAGDVVRANLRYSVTGAAGTGDTVLDLVQNPNAVTAAGLLLPMNVVYLPPSTSTVSVLLSVARVSGTGTVSIGAGSINPIVLWIVDVGDDPGDSGVSL